MTCDNCKKVKFYTTGADEYPPNVTFEYCSAGFWDTMYGEDPDAPMADIWVNCPEFLKKEFPKEQE